MGGVVGAGEGVVETVGVGLAVGVEVAGGVRFDRSDDLLVDRSELPVVSWSGLGAHEERTTSSTSDKTGMKNVVRGPRLTRLQSWRWELGFNLPPQENIGGPEISPPIFYLRHMSPQLCRYLRTICALDGIASI